jgi:hypothetical protein
MGSWIKIAGHNSFTICMHSITRVYVHSNAPTYEYCFGEFFHSESWNAIKPKNYDIPVIGITVPRRDPCCTPGKG